MCIVHLIRILSGLSFERVASCQSPQCFPPQSHLHHLHAVPCPSKPEFILRHLVEIDFLLSVSGLYHEVSGVRRDIGHFSLRLIWMTV